MGAAAISEGSEGPIRLGEESETIVAQGTSRYRELARRGKLFVAGTASVGFTVITAVGGSISPLAAAPTDPLLMLINPVGSDVTLSILRTVAHLVSGTPGAGGLWYNTAMQVAAITGTTTAPRPCLVGGAACTAQMITGNVTATGSLAMTKHSHVGGWTTGASALGASSIVDNVDGMIEVPPGGVLALAPGAVGTSFTIAAAILFAELPYIN
jgi:hypothetical protein